jgi:predicted deacylase
MAKIDDLEKALTLMQHQLADRTTELDSFLIHAHSGGTFHPIVRSGQQVSADSVVAEIQPTIPIATFHIDDPQPFAVNASVELAICKGEQRVTCTIVDVQPDSVKVSCPAHPPLAEGTAVALKPPG